MLQFPPTIRLPLKSELPKNTGWLNRWKKSKKALIVPGYHMKVPVTGDVPFRFYAQINVNYGDLWALLMDLVDELPEEVSLMYGLEDDALQYSNYTSKQGLIHQLKPYQKELTQDPRLQWGFFYQDEYSLTELLVAPCKYLQFWGNHKAHFRVIAEQYQLKEIPDIAFIDEYPKVTLSPQSLDSTVLSSEELIDRLGTF